MSKNKYRMPRKLRRYIIIKGEIPLLVNKDLIREEKVNRAVDALDAIANDLIIEQGLKSSELKTNWKDIITGFIMGAGIFLFIGVIIGLSGWL